MSDRTQGSVRTESPAGDVDAPDDTPKGAPKSVAATQAIPTTGSHRAAQASVTGGTPATAASAGTTPANGASAGATVAAAPATGAPKAASTAGRTTGAPATSAPAGQRAGSPAVVGPVPPATGPSPAAAPQQTTTTATEPTSGRAAHARGPSRVPGRGPRRARLQLRHIDTWSALKISLVLSIALFFIWMVAVGILYGVLSGLGVFDTLNDLFGQLGSASGSSGKSEIITPGIVFGGAAVIGAINVILMTALCTVGTFIYNLCADLVGGLEVTLSERD